MYKISEVINDHSTSMNDKQLYSMNVFGFRISGILRQTLLSAVLCMTVASPCFATDTDIAFSIVSSNEIAITCCKTNPPSSRGITTSTDALRIKLLLPENSEQSQIVVFLKDRDGHWFQQLLPDTLHAGTNTVTCDLRPDFSAKWQTSGHSMIFNHRVKLAPQLAGARIFPSSAQFMSVTSVTDPPPSSPPNPAHIRQNTEFPACFSLFETRFALPDRYDDPFDPTAINVNAVISTPEGKTNSIPCFYIQDYIAVTNATGDYHVPTGRPEWAFRYTPLTNGLHICRIVASDNYGCATSAPVAFTALPASGPDFVRISKKDPRRFAVAEQEFIPVGHNIRSPFDTRMDDQFPWLIRHPRGFMIYDDYFRKMAKCGENIAEIWMCQWSLGLEWSETAPEYHGIGDYNLANAWELDQVLAMARAYGLRINLVLNNHGRAGLGFDAEWQNSPYNIRNGGFLPEDDPLQFFSNEKAIEYQKRITRYITARWGWDSTVFAWELWSELDLCGKSGEKPAPQFNKNVIAWHAAIGDYMKSIDPNRHLVSTHLSANYQITSPELASLPQLDHCCIDAYHFQRNPLHIATLVRDTASYYAQFKKPVMITEFGGSSMGAGLSHLKTELHAAIWSSLCTPLAGTPFFWWWGVIDEQNLYPEYTAAQKFISEPPFRTDPALHSVLLGFSPYAEHLDQTTMANGTNLFAWIYRKYTPPTNTAAQASLTTTWAPVSNGTYRVIFTDTSTGLPFKQQDFRSTGTKVSFPLPEFEKDIAIKAYLKEQ